MKMLFFFLNLGKSINRLTSTMKKSMFDYTKTILERVSFDPVLFCKELQKALKMLLPYEVEQLADWLFSYTDEKPELKQYLILVNR